MKRNVAMAVAATVTVVFSASVAWGPDLFGRRAPLPDIADPGEESDDDEEPTAARQGPPKGAPNVVLVFGCTVRKDQLPMYGGPADTMPWLQTFANEGATFEDALSVSSWTRASAVGVLASAHPLSFNLPEPGPKQSQRVLPEQAVLLAEVLQDAGWDTLGATANPNLNRQYGMAQGMDWYQDSVAKPFNRNRPSGMGLVNDALEALDQRAETDNPFYLQLMLIDAHHPRTPSPDRVAAFKKPGVSPELASYRASLTHLDDALDQLDRGLASRGYDPRNTLFVFIADHGEGLNLPVHHGPGHGKKMYASTVEVPWILRGPGVKKGHRIQGLASGVDVMPTLTNLLGLRRPKTSVGADNSNFVRGRNLDPLPRKQTFAYSMFHRADVGSVWTADRQCQQYFEHDLDRHVTGCFDRKADPTFTDAIEDNALLAKLVKFRKQRIKEANNLDITQTEVGDDVSDQLKMLGYVDD